MSSSPRPTTPIREIEHCWIELSDGVRLAARLWLPHDADTRPAPAILEYLPYRKRDFTVFRDRQNHAYLAEHGYAAVRVDMRGTGDSDGVLLDEYTEQEQRDGLEVLAWIRRQPWCDGSLGMWGISWGGFNSLQMASLRPAGLKAVIAMAFADDRYASDLHYCGGLLLADNPMWAAAMLSGNSMPPDPLVYGEAWKEAWSRRLDASPPWIEPWLEHQRRDAYWAHGSICEDYSAIACPVMAVTGWEDSYTEPLFRVMQHLDVPRKALVGPWAHCFPHQGQPEPAIGFLQECVRWWDHWLKGRDTGVMDEPALRMWMQTAVRPQRTYESRPGRWVAEAAWPAPRLKTRTFFLDGRDLAPRPGAAAQVVVATPLSTGEVAGRFAGYGGGPDMPPDQRPDDGRSICFDSAVLDEDFEIVGAPQVVLQLTSDRPQAMVVVRLCEVWPDGASTRVSWGCLNLSHRDGPAQPAPLVPGETYRVTVPLRMLAHRFAAGNRLRLAVSNSYWPMVWPSPEAGALTLELAGSQLSLPERPPHALDETLAPFGPPEEAAPEPVTELRPGGAARRLLVDEIADHRVIDMDSDYGDRRVDAYDLTATLISRESTAITGEDPNSAVVDCAWTNAMQRGAWRAETKSGLTMTSTADAFHYDAFVEAFENGELFARKTWRRSFPRDGL